MKPARFTQADVERALDPLMWGWCALACWLTSVLPITRRGSLLDRITFWLLPFAGFYAYHDPECGTTWRWSQRVRKTEPGGPF